MISPAADDEVEAACATQTTDSYDMQLLKYYADFSCASSDDFYIQFRSCPLAYGKCLGPNWWALGPCCRVFKVIEQMERVLPRIAAVQRCSNASSHVLVGGCCIKVIG